MTAIIHPDASVDRIGEQTSSRVARRGRGLSDHGIAWLFVTPTIALLLAINIFPLIWMIRLSFTSLNLSMSYLPLRFVGLDNYADILSDEDLWVRLQTTAQFVISTVVLEMLIGFGLALLINRQFRSHSFWTTIILLFQPQIGPFNYVISLFTGIPPSSFSMTGEVALAPWTIVLVDTWMWAPYVMLICLAGLRSIPDYIYEAAEVDRASSWRQFWSITLPMALPFLMLAVLFRAIENFKMFDMVNLLTSGGPGSTTELVSITLKRAAFEKWRTGYSSALAIILFVTVFGAANIYVKALNRVKQR
jgi:multiple sugar transport system permease protein